MARRTPEQNRAYYQQRQAAARAKGFASYGEQRKYRAEAQKLVPGRTKKDIAARDEVAKRARDYKEGEAKEPDFRDAFDDIADQFDVEFTDNEWYDFLDEISPKSE